MSEEPFDPHHEPIAIPIPASLGRILEHAQHHHDQDEMQRDVVEQQINAFVDGLAVEQAMALRLILNMDQKSLMSQYYDGQLVGLLRYVHHVDPNTGKSRTEELGDAASTR